MQQEVSSAQSSGNPQDGIALASGVTGDASQNLGITRAPTQYEGTSCIAAMPLSSLTGEIEARIPPRKKVKRGLDAAVLRRAIVAAESIRFENKIDLAVGVSSLSACVCTLWETAEGSSSEHRQVLAAVDGVLLQLSEEDTGTEAQIQAIGDGLRHLGMSVLTKAEVDSIFEAMIVAGLNPIAAFFGDGCE